MVRCWEEEREVDKAGSDPLSSSSLLMLPPPDGAAPSLSLDPKELWEEAGRNLEGVAWAARGEVRPPEEAVVVVVVVVSTLISRDEVGGDPEDEY